MISSLTDLVYPSAAAPPPAATAAMPSMRVQRADSKLSCAEAEGTATVHRHSGIPQAPIESVLAAQSIEQEYSVFDGISHFASPNFACGNFKIGHFSTVTSENSGKCVGAMYCHRYNLA